MQRPIPATRSLPFDEAKAALRRVRDDLKSQGFTRAPYDMCAEIDRYGAGWAVYVGFQPDANLSKASAALLRSSKKPSKSSLTWGFSALTHSI
ncbi:hypothetical protein FNV58_00670 (plasmid) [Streptomyces sp. RLB1-9]|uniref:hypothetical protein n=1 Tax=Streptomyces sp. RLB1-9 TaxID=2594454 RepID=UPI001163AEDF|nr:hypothetical protein [Streptomyces sp. RLB1-9]QDN94873.1 hypothetical protein FNV58_00670 [Streptomyces sp. RLB1-9]